MSEEKEIEAKEVHVRDVSTLDVSDNLKEQILVISGKCIKCKLCQKECAFLRKYGKPKDIADSYDPNDRVYQGMPFECSLCQLCAAVCPVEINPARMFLEMRRHMVKNGNVDFPEHKGILAYEKRGTS
jgi:heterodisulfide reductase subunit C